MKRSILLVVMVVLRICLPTQGQPWLGSGTEAEPYLIEDANDMQAIGADPNYWGAHFKLTNDINLAKYTDTQFNIIGNSTTPFTGVFDGNRFIISNLTISSVSDYIGLFGFIDSGEVMNLSLNNVSITGDDKIGSLAGYINNSVISQCHSNGMVRNAVGYASQMMGGLIGEAEDSELFQCGFDGTVEGGYSGTGGLVGHNRGSITECYSVGSVIGGVIGGLVGSHYDSVILNCYSLANVSNTQSSSLAVGGLVGHNQSEIIQCFCAGLITWVTPCDECVGGLVGGPGGTIIDSFWNSEINPGLNGIGGITDPCNVTGESTVNMQTESTFSDWDFVETWNIGENQTYPYLRVYPAGDLNHDGRVNLLDFAIFSERWMAGIE